MANAPPVECSNKYLSAGTPIMYKFTGPPLQASEFGWIFGEVEVARSKVRLRQDPSTNFWVIFKSAASMVPMRFATRAGFVAGSRLSIELRLEIENYGHQWVVLEKTGM